jgi:hypothetical protein
MKEYWLEQHGSAFVVKKSTSHLHIVLVVIAEFCIQRVCQ